MPLQLILLFNNVEQRPTLVINYHRHTHTHTFNGPLSRTTWVSRYKKRKTSLDFTEARDSEWQWHQLGHMQVFTSMHKDNHASTPPLSFLTGRMPFLPPNQQRQSTITINYHRQWQHIGGHKNSTIRSAYNHKCQIWQHNKQQWTTGISQWLQRKSSWQPQRRGRQ